MASQPSFPTPLAIAETGQKIYDTRYKAELEKDRIGQFVAINIKTEQASIGATPEAALGEGKRQDPHGLFHLVRIGYSSVYSGSSLISHARPNQDWIFGC